MTNLQLSELLDRYLKGKCTDEEAAIVNQWYASKESAPAHLELLSATERKVLKDKMLANILVPAQSSYPAMANEEQKGRVMHIFRKWWFRAAAAAVVLLLIRIFMFAPAGTKQVATTHQTSFFYTNNSHHILKKTLPDGSIVWLKPQASLTVPKVFSKPSRQVTMNGECFFEITKNPARPFIIRSAHIITKVWGTSFRVVDYEHTDKATVKVISGKVSVSKKQNEQVETSLTKGEVMLLPKQKVVYNGADKSLVAASKIDMHDMDLWKRIDLSFDNDKLSSIINELNRNFNVNIQIRDEKLKDKLMTADLSGLNLPEVLEVLKASMRIDYQISGDQITIN